MLLKINMALGCLVVVSSHLVGMQITTPYKPGFAACHPKATNVGKSLLAAGGACALGACVQKMIDGDSSSSKDSLILAGLGVTTFAVSYFYNKTYNRRSLVDSLLVDPQETIKDIYTTRDEFIAHGQREGLDKEKDATKLIQGFDTLLQQYEQKCPIFLLGECTDANDWFPCVFTRSINPSYRKRFEEKVSQSLVEKIASNQLSGPINYTSFGCGGALPEMIILTKVLAQKPDTCLNIHLIEGNNIVYVFAVDHLNISREITCDQKLFELKDDYIQIVKQKDGITDRDDNDIKVQITENCFETQKKYKQMLTWLTQTFPNAKLSLFVHEFTDNYLAYLDKHNLSHADIVSAADIQDEMSYLRHGPKNYVKLCVKTLDKNKSASNWWLAKDYQNNREEAQICSLSLSNSEGAEKIDIENLSAYMTSQKL